jgi:hypothetical protein
MSEDLGPGGAIADGGSTQSSSESSDSTETSSDAGSDSDDFVGRRDRSRFSRAVTQASRPGGSEWDYDRQSPLAP